MTPPLLKGRTRSRCWPTLLHRGSQCPLHCRLAPAQVACHRPRPALPCRSRRSALRRRSLHSACPLTADRGDASAVAAAGAEADGSRAGAAVSVSSVGTPAPERVRGVLPDGGAPGASAFAAAHTTRDSVHSRHQSAPRRHIPAAVRRHVWLRDGGRCCYRDPLTGRRCTSSHLLADRPPAASRSGRWPGAVQPQSALLCSSQNAPRPRTGCAAGGPDVAPHVRCCRSARRRLAGGQRNTLRIAARRACIFAAASSDPGRGLPSDGELVRDPASSVDSSAV